MLLYLVALRNDTNNKVVNIWQTVNNFSSKRGLKVIVVSYDKYNLKFMLLYYWIIKVVAKKQNQNNDWKAMHFISSPQLVLVGYTHDLI